MSPIEFHLIINRLSLNSAATPTDAQLDARLPEIWDHVQSMPAERFARAVKWLVQQPDFKFFPTVGEIMEAVRRADREAGEYVFNSNMSEEEFRLTYDPEYRREQQAISENAAKEFFASEEYQRLLRIVSTKEPHKPQAELPPLPSEEELARLHKPRQNTFQRCTTCHGSGRNPDLGTTGEYCHCEHGTALARLLGVK